MPSKKSERKYKVVCLTGGPGAGKTSLSDILQRQFSKDFVIVPESATILYRGGFPRAHSPAEMKYVQEAIYHTQVAAEGLARLNARDMAGVICDRGTLDGAAYWPGSTANFLTMMDTTLKTELDRYDLVIHMQSPSANGGYDMSNPIRTESAQQARVLDRKIQRVWSAHPRQIIVTHKNSFIEKVEEVLSILRQELPSHF